MKVGMFVANGKTLSEIEYCVEWSNIKITVTSFKYDFLKVLYFLDDSLG